MRGGGEAEPGRSGPREMGHRLCQRLWPGSRGTSRVSTPRRGAGSGCSRALGQESLTFGDLKLQGEGSGLALGKGRWEEEDLDIDREGAAAHGVGAADAESAEKWASAACRRAGPLACHAGGVTKYQGIRLSI